jgi:preprotein translocase subunit SecG
MGERANDRDGLVNVDAIEHARYLGTVDFRAPHPEGFHPRTLDKVEYLLAVVLAHGVTEDRSQQPDVGAHRLGRLPPQRRPMDVADRVQRGIRNLCHGSQYRRLKRSAPVVGGRLGRLPVMELGLQITLVVTSVLVVLLVLLHRAKGGGLSTLFGGGVQSSLSGSTVVEKNLDRLTLFITGIWLVSVIGVALLIKYR